MSARIGDRVVILVLINLVEDRGLSGEHPEETRRGVFWLHRLRRGKMLAVIEIGGSKLWY